ncbi:MAG TPA: CPBP family intramembrane glutamic endopeptidase, partial [Candidatus Elarobacter sp.]
IAGGRARRRVKALSLRVDTPTRYFAMLWLLALVFATATIGLQMAAVAITFVLVLGVLAILTALWTQPVTRYGARATTVVFTIACVLLAAVFALVVYDGLFFWRIVTTPLPGWTDVTRAIGLFAQRLGLPSTALLNPFAFVVLPAVLLAPLRLGREGFGLGRFRPGAWKVALLWIGVGVAVPLVELVVRSWDPALLGFRFAADFVPNGFSEEFLCRGVILGVLASRIGPSGANVVQAVAFAVFHAGSELRDYHSLIVGMSHSLLTNGVIGYALGFVTLRTGNIAIAGAFHALLDAWIVQ